MGHYDIQDRECTMPFESFYAQVRRIGPMYLDPLVRPILAAQEASDEDAKEVAFGSTRTAPPEFGGIGRMGSSRSSTMSISDVFNEVRRSRRTASREESKNSLRARAHSLAQQAHNVLEARHAAFHST